MQGPEPINLAELPDKIRPLAPLWGAVCGVWRGAAVPAKPQGKWGGAAP